MFNAFSNLSITDKLQLISIVSTTLISIISIFIALATLKQNSKVIGEANRPYLAIYYEIVNVSSYVTYLILKNFGTTGAIIDSVTPSFQFDSGYNSEPFSLLKNHFIAPSQKITTACRFEKPYQIVTFTINYHNGNKKYSESFVINPESISNMILAKSSSGKDTNLEKIISYSAQEIIRTNL